MMSTALATETAQQESEAVREEREEVRLLDCVVCSSFISLESCCRSHSEFRKIFHLNTDQKSRKTILQ